MNKNRNCVLKRRKTDNVYIMVKTCKVIESAMRELNTNGLYALSHSRPHAHSSFRRSVRVCRDNGATRDRNMELGEAS